MNREFVLMTGVEGKKLFDTALSMLYTSEVIYSIFPIYKGETLNNNSTPYIPEKLPEICDFIKTIQKPWARHP